MASSLDRGHATITNADAGFKADTGDKQHLTVVKRMNFIPSSLLSELINTTVEEVFAIPELQRRLQANQMTGLGSDEVSGTDTVTFEEAATYTTHCRCPNMCEVFERLREKRVLLKIDNRHSLALEVKDVHSRLVAIQAKCTEIEQSRYRNNEKNSNLSPEQWDALEAISRTLWDEGPGLSVASLSLSPQLQQFRKIAYDHSLRSRNLRRFNDRLLPLLRREQDLESAQQWLEMMRLSSSLLDILGKNGLLFIHEENELLDTIDQIEDILMEMMSWFRRKYKSLTRKKDATEDESLAEVIFEFPNNIRHTCTTMPWTIRSALLVLWGVCWMFIIGAGQRGHEELKAVNPLVSPMPAVYDLYGGFPDYDIQDTLSESIVDYPDAGEYVGQGLLDHFVFENIEGINDDINNALAFSQAVPQDPNFLAKDLMYRNDTEGVGLLGRGGSAELSSTTPMQSLSLGASLSTSKTCAGDATGSADASEFGNRKTSSEKRVTKQKLRFVCPSCKQTFSTSFTLTRHQTEIHQQKSPSSEMLFPCPNPGCKKSSGKSPFKRGSHLKRHLDTCKHHREYLQRQDDQTYSRSTSASTPASQPQEVGTEQEIRFHGLKKRPRPKDDERSDELPLAGIWKKYKNMKDEVKQKKDAYLLAQEKLKAFEKDIQDLAGSLSDS